MKNFLLVIVTIVAMLSITPILDAQDEPGAIGRERPALRYRLVDLGTFGGPNSSETVEFPYINNAGMVVGYADTPVPDLNPEGFVFHAFRWKGTPLIDLGSLPDGTNSFAIWSNNRGQVVGQSENGVIDPVLGFPEGRATLWDQHGEVIDLGTLGGNEGLAVDINDRGQVVGAAANDIPDQFSIFGWGTQMRAFLWQNGKMRDLGTLGGPDAFAYFVNEGGQVAGISYVGNSPVPTCDLLSGEPGVPTHPFFWEHGRMVDIGTLGGTCAFTATINNRGQVAGSANLTGDQTEHPFLWERGKMRDLGTLGGTFGLANWLNDAGEVAGVATTTGDEFAHAFFWQHGVMIDLGTIKDDPCSIAHFMNVRGQVVGTSGCTDTEIEVHGFLWEPGGTMIDLNDFVPPGSNLRVTDGETISDSGEIAGSGELPNGDFHAIVLVPCDDSEKDCLSARTQNSGPMAGPHTLLPHASGPKLNARDVLAAVQSRMARRYHSVSHGVGAHR
jgi:probable HAF family extracellular repeat protein